MVDVPRHIRQDCYGQVRTKSYPAMLYLVCLTVINGPWGGIRSTECPSC